VCVANEPRATRKLEKSTKNSPPEPLIVDRGGGGKKKTKIYAKKERFISDKWGEKTENRKKTRKFRGNHKFTAENGGKKRRKKNKNAANYSSPFVRKRWPAHNLGGGNVC